MTTPLAKRTARQELAILQAQRKPLAQLSLKHDLDQTALEAAALRFAVTLTPGETPDLSALAVALAESAADSKAVTPGEWVRAAATLFPDAAAAEANLLHYINRYGL